MTKDHGSQIKNDDQYETLRDKGMSKEKAARIANTSSDEMDYKEGSGNSYESWTKEELYDKAQKAGIEGRSTMDKKELIHALRNH